MGLVLLNSDAPSVSGDARTDPTLDATPAVGRRRQCSCFGGRALGFYVVVAALVLCGWMPLGCSQASLAVPRTVAPQARADAVWSKHFSQDSEWRAGEVAYRCLADVTFPGASSLHVDLTVPTRDHSRSSS
jgi:hypothetical protein